HARRLGQRGAVPLLVEDEERGVPAEDRLEGTGAERERAQIALDGPGPPARLLQRLPIEVEADERRPRPVQPREVPALTAAEIEDPVAGAEPQRRRDEARLDPGHLGMEQGRGGPAVELAEEGNGLHGAIVAINA